jgi:hypothetical protein
MKGALGRLHWVCVPLEGTAAWRLTRSRCGPAWSAEAQGIVPRGTAWRVQPPWGACHGSWYGRAPAPEQEADR